MRTVQMTLEPDLIRDVDAMAKFLHMMRSGFTRQALKDAILHFKVKSMEEKHRKGYQAKPLTKDETEGWEKAQAWGEDEAW